MRCSIRAIRDSRVGNPPVGPKSRLRSAAAPAIVGVMVLRRELLSILLATAILLVGAGQALAAPQWLPAQPLPASLPSLVDPAVATDADGNSIAVWIDRDAAPDEVQAVYRPRGGPWETTATGLEQEFTVVPGTAPRAVALPGGSFVVVWVANRNGVSAPVLRSATRAPSGAWTTARRPRVLLPLDRRPRGGRGRQRHGRVAERRELGLEHQGVRERALGCAPAAAASESSGTSRSGRTAARSRSARASAAGPTASGRATARRAGRGAGRRRWASRRACQVLGLAVAASPDASATAVWAAASEDGEGVGPPGDVLSADRTPGPQGTWGTEPDCGRPPRGRHAELRRSAASTSRRARTAPSSRPGSRAGRAASRSPPQLRSAGGDWVGPETVSGTVRGNDAPHAAITTSGVPVVAWSSNANNESADANGSHRDAAGELAPGRCSADRRTTPSPSATSTGTATATR